MTRALLAAAVLLSLSPVFAAGPREEAPAAPATPATPVVAPAMLTPLSLTNGPAAPGMGLSAAPALPAAGPAAAPASLPASAVLPAAAAAAPSPSGRNQGEVNAYASPDGSANVFGPAPGAPGAETARERADQQDSQQQAGPAALRQLKAELSALQKEQRRLDTNALRIAVGQKDAPSVDALKAADDARQRAAALTPQIQAKRAQLQKARSAQRTAYRVLKDQLSALKDARANALAEARASAATGADFKGGSEEARARALERAAGLDARIAEKKKAIALMERDNPGLAGLRAPLVVARKAMGLAPKTAQEQRLHDEIAALEAQVSREEMAAMQLFQVQKQHPDIGAAEEGVKHQNAAAALRKMLDQKRAELKALSGR